MNKLFIFAVGAGIGSAVTCFITKNYYKKIADEEIASVKETYSKKATIPADHIEAGKMPESVPEEKLYKPSEADLITLKHKIEENGYVNYSTSRGYKEEEDMSDPFVIPPDEFDENDYETESLTYWNDGVLTDTTGWPIEDVPGTVGEDFADHFGEYEDDSVFVRNDRLHVDYEILKDTRNFRDVYPNRMED